MVGTSCFFSKFKCVCAHTCMCVCVYIPRENTAESALDPIFKFFRQNLFYYVPAPVCLVYTAV